MGDSLCLKFGCRLDPVREIERGETTS